MIPVEVGLFDFGIHFLYWIHFWHDGDCLFQIYLVSLPFHVSNLPHPAFCNSIIMPSYNINFDP